MFKDGGEILQVNETLANWLGYEQGQLRGVHIDKILSLASRIFYNTHFFPLVRLHGRAEEIFLNLRTREGEDVPMISNTVRQHGDGGWENVTAFIRVYQRKKFEEEILNARRAAELALKENKELQTLSKELEQRSLELDKQYQRLVAVNQDLVQFSKIVSHDFQEPIRKVKLFSGMLDSTHGDDVQEKSRLIRRIEAAADRLTQLTQGLQQYVQVDSMKEVKPVNLDEAFSAALEKLRTSRNANNLQVKKDPLPTIEGHRMLLELLFYHLLDNAVRFGKPGEDLVVTISSTLLDENVYRALPGKYRFLEHVRLIFMDNGAGFDNAYGDYVFELIKKIDPTTTGIGIGLPLIKKIMDNHHGSVRIESSPGVGTKVFLVFPLKGSRE